MGAHASCVDILSPPGYFNGWRLNFSTHMFVLFPWTMPVTLRRTGIIQVARKREPKRSKSSSVPDVGSEQPTMLAKEISHYIFGEPTALLAHAALRKKKKRNEEF